VHTGKTNGAVTLVAVDQVLTRAVVLAQASAAVIVVDLTILTTPTSLATAGVVVHQVHALAMGSAAIFRQTVVNVSLTKSTLKSWHTDTTEQSNIVQASRIVLTRV
jgi:hypothetical protein